MAAEYDRGSWGTRARAAECAPTRSRAPDSRDPRGARPALRHSSTRQRAPSRISPRGETLELLYFSSG
jgi:hypothetical protein